MEPYTTADPDAPVSGTAAGPGRRPGAHKPGRKRSRKPPPKISNAERLQVSLAADELAERVCLLRAVRKTFAAIAVQINLETGKDLNERQVRNIYDRRLREVKPSDYMRAEHYEQLSSLAGQVREKSDEMDRRGIDDPDTQVKYWDIYLKILARIERMFGLDKPPPPLPVQSVMNVSGSMAVFTPGSLSAFEEWQHLEQKGLTQVSREVLELNESDVTEVVPMLNGEKAGVTLRPDADVTPGAERREPLSALDALEQLQK